MTHTFKVGDRVRCVDAKDRDHILTHGVVYTVAKCVSYGTTPYVGLKGVNEEAPVLWAARFEPAVDGAPATITDSHGVERRVVALSAILAVFEKEIEGWADAYTSGRVSFNSAKSAESGLRNAKDAIRKLFNHEVDDDES